MATARLYTTGAMRRTAFRRGLVLAVLALAPALADAQSDATGVDALVRDLKGPDYERAIAAESELRKHPAARAQVVAGLIAALRTGEWNRCGGDVRDAIARELREHSKAISDLVTAGTWRGCPPPFRMRHGRCGIACDARRRERRIGPTSQR
jgi:hypothetical protein